MQDGYVTLLLDGDRLIVSTNGYLYCLDPRTGQMRWSNAMEGFGMGTPTALCSARGSANPTTEMAHQRDVKIETWQK
jgi:outer membrane protein assembly factor BamB